MSIAWSANRMTLEPRLGRLPVFSSTLLACLAAAGCGSSASSSGDHDTADSGTELVEAGVDSGHVEDTGASDSGEQAEAGPQVLAIPIASCTGDSYAASVTIGGTQHFELLLDTGSTTLAVASNTCTNCTNIMPLYTPGATAKDQNQMATATYGSGTWTGEIYQDTVVVGTSPSIPDKLVAIDSETVLPPVQCNSSPNSIQGILGFGPAAAASAGTTGFFEQLVATTGMPNVFATQLCDTGGTLWLGGYDVTATTGPVQYTPKATTGLANVYHQVTLASVTVGGMTVPVSTATPSAVDTGTSVFLVGSTPYAALSAAIQANATFTQIFGAGFFPAVSASPAPNCKAGITQTKAQLDAMLPPLTLTMGSSPAIEVQAVATESYLMNIEGEWCTGMLGYDFGQYPLASIMGAALLKSNVVVFDQVQNRIGFAPHATCQ
jgi:hypothetical protein